VSTAIPIIGVILEARLDSSGQRLSIPEHRLDAIGMKDGDEVELVIKHPGPADRDLFRGKKRLKVTNHAYEVSDIGQNLMADEDEIVLVYVLKPSKYGK
jgi:hypothetical protein